MQSLNRHKPGVIVTGNNSINNLGVVRNLGKHHIPIILLVPNYDDMVQYSRYVSRRVTCPNPKESEIRFVRFLKDFGKQADEKHLMIPTSDREVLVLSKYKEELEQFFFLPVPDFEVVQKLVNKKKFYRLLDRMSVPHPKTYFPEDISELEHIGHRIEYPYIIKPAYSHLFLEQFYTKCFIINSSKELTRAIRMLSERRLEVMVQEIIPGKEIYMFYTYFNKESEPLAVCGYDKFRQFPPDFGSGSLCKSAWRNIPIELGIEVLKNLRYHGISEPELKKDPRDGRYKMLEINARTTTQSGLAAKCGVNIEYIAYLDMLEQCVIEERSPQDLNTLWINDDGFRDLRSCLIQLLKGRIGVKDVFVSFRGQKTYAVASLDDPIPLFISLRNFARAELLKR